MTRSARPSDPLAGTELVLVDANNLLHALGRVPEAGGARAYVAQLRAVIPAPARIALVFDGRGDPGMRAARIASGVDTEFAGRRTADDVIADRVELEARAGGPVAVAAILVVSDDHELRERVRVRGARTARATWLATRLTGRAAKAPPRADRAPRAAAASADPDEADADDDRPRWRGGRGATTKRGNPRRAPRRGGRGAPPR